MATQIKIIDTNARLAITAKFDNGDDFTLSATQARDKFGAGQRPATPKLAQEDFQAIVKWCKLRDDESCYGRNTRIEALCKKATSLEGLALLVSLEAEHA